MKILFTATFSTPFIQDDLKILHRHFTVTEIFSSGITTFLRYFFAIGSTDISFSWFASVYSSILVFFTKLFKKKSIIILGGVDVAKIPELNYGIWNSWWKSIIVRYGMRNADLILAVDESLKKNAVRLAAYDGKNIHVLPTGYDAEQWRPGNQKENFILTVASCATMTRVKIKGIDFLIDVANSLQDINFTLIGLDEKIASQLKFPDNLKHYGSVQQSELLEMYQHAKVFFQPSMREGLPNTLCEAMLCGCFPVGTNVGGIPAVIGETGIVVQHGNVEEAKNALQRALTLPSDTKAIDRITQQYSINKREEQLMMYISSLGAMKNAK